MSELITKIYGPPGTGKTTRLTAVANRAAQLVGPDQLCAITFTRAGADEIKQRIAVSLGMPVPPDPWQRRKLLDARLPWVGTIHSLAYKLIGRPPTLRAADLTEFIARMGGRASGMLQDVDAQEGYAWAEPGRDEVEAALAVISGARHRMIGLLEAYDKMPWGYQGPTVSPERVEFIARAYADFKQQTGRIDFEDMLELGQSERPPAQVFLVDEVQDNSPLLWSVTDAWTAGHKTYLAGDPYQAIYLFSGAAPDLFINHTGTLYPLGDSRRLTARASEAAQRVLREAGVLEGQWLGTWTGTGAGEQTDGSEFYLARTNRLLHGVYQDLEDEGTPYGYMRGGGPLKQKAASGFRTLMQLRRTGGAPASAVSSLVEECESSYLPQGLKARMRALAKADPDMLLGPETLPSLEAGALGLKHARYYERVLSRHGPRAFVLEPSVRVGTIHAAKGKEADTVHLVSSWGTLPYRSATSSAEGALAEGCVAYVALTRHRVALHLIPGDEGIPYPGF
jgi:superfamily I DNA/RNA helicase